MAAFRLGEEQMPHKVNSAYHFLFGFLDRNHYEIYP